MLTLVCVLVHWEYAAKRDDDITVKRGDTVTLVDHHRLNIEGKKPVTI